MVADNAAPAVSGERVRLCVENIDGKDGVVDRVLDCAIRMIGKG